MTAHGFRDRELEQEVLALTQSFGIGAQFGGKYFCHDVRVIRLPRHGASCPVAIAVSCSADRQALGKITAEGVFLEELERDPATFLPETTRERLTVSGGSGDTEAEAVVRIDLNRPMPDYLREHAVYYAGRAKTPEGYASGSFGPTTAGRMDSYVEAFQSAGVEYAELGMEAVWKIEVEDFPAFVVVDDKGNDFFAETAKPLTVSVRRRSEPGTDAGGG